MTDPIRAALERLIARLDETTDPNGPVPAWSDSFYAARAALAQPAPPDEGDEGRQPSGYAYRYQSLGSSVIRFNGGGEVNGSRPVEAIPYWLGRPPQPAPPAEGEVGELVALIRQIALAWEPDACLLGNMTAGQLARAADLLEQRHPTPVPVGERLPGSEDCDEQGRCWWLCPPDFMELRSHATAESAFVAGATHWLPAHALPLPAGEVQP